MKKTRKRLFAFSGLVVLVAQVLVMALCSIPAIAVTREETNRTLFNNEHGSATISYEEMESGGLNWTINLQKAAHDTATRFMVAMTADGQAIMPENVQTVMQSTPEISFTAGNGEGLMLAGLQEGAAGSGAGSAVITYQTSGDYGQMAVVPKLVTVGDTVSDLLAGNPGVVYDIPVKEEPAATEEAVTGELPLTEEQTATTEAPEAEVVESTTDSQVAEATESTTESTVADEATVATEVTESTEAEATETTDSSEAVVEGEPTESTTEDSTATTESSSEAEDETGDSSEATEASDEADDEQGFVNYSEEQRYTALRFEKTWVNVPADAPSIEVVIKRRVVGSSEWSDYAKHEYSPSDAVNGVTVDEWHNLPIKDETGGPYEYTLEEIPNPYYTTVQGDTIASQIKDIVQVPQNNETTWKYEKPGFIVAHTKEGFFIWTVDPVDNKQAFLDNVKNYVANGGVVGGTGNSFKKFVDDANLSNTVWATGNYSNEEYGISTKVNYETSGDYTAEITFDAGTSIWTQFFYGGHTTKTVPITNTYVEPTKITVQKNWEDSLNVYDTRNEDIRLALQVYQYNSDAKIWEWVDVDDKFLDISAGTTEKSIEQEFTVPTKTLDENGGYVDAQYRVIEKVKDAAGNYTGDRVYGYATPTPTDPKAGDYTVTNTLLKTDLSFTKVNGQGTALPGVTFGLTRIRISDDKTQTWEWGSVISAEDGSVNFSGLPVGNYTLTELKTVDGYKIEGPWTFEVVDNNGVLSIKGTGESPIENGATLANNLKPFDLTVKKVNENDEELLGATFELSGGDLEKPISIVGGSEFKFKDLKPGTYTLTETDAPDGYAKLIDSITIKIEKDGTVTIEGIDESHCKVDNAVPDDEDPKTINNNTITITVANKKLVPLPATGGPGTLLFFVMGILAIAVTGIYFVSRQKQEVA